MTGSSVRLMVAVGVVALGFGSATIVQQQQSNRMPCFKQILGCPMRLPVDAVRNDLEAAGVALAALVLAAGVLVVRRTGPLGAGVGRLAVAFGTVAVAIPAAVVIERLRVWHLMRLSPFGVRVYWTHLPQWETLSAALIAAVAVVLAMTVLLARRPPPAPSAPGAVAS